MDSIAAKINTYCGDNSRGNRSIKFGGALVAKLKSFVSIIATAIEFGFYKMRLYLLLLQNDAVWKNILGV